MCRYYTSRRAVQNMIMSEQTRGVKYFLDISTFTGGQRKKFKKKRNYSLRYLLIKYRYYYRYCNDYFLSFFRITSTHGVCNRQIKCQRAVQPDTQRICNLHFFDILTCIYNRGVNDKWVHMSFTNDRVTRYELTIQNPSGVKHVQFTSFVYCIQRLYFDPLSEPT